MCEYYSKPNEMIAHNIIVSFCIFSLFSLLKYGKIFGKNLRHDNYGVKQIPWPSTLGGGHGLVSKICVSFVLMKHLSNYDNIFVTETW